MASGGAGLIDRVRKTDVPGTSSKEQTHTLSSPGPQTNCHNYVTIDRYSRSRMNLDCFSGTDAVGAATEVTALMLIRSDGCGVVRTY